MQWKCVQELRGAYQAWAWEQFIRLLGKVCVGTNCKFSGWEWPPCELGLTASLRRPCIHAIFFWPHVGQRVNTHSVFWESCQKPCQHATLWLWQMLDDVYTRRCFSESEGTRFGAPGQKSLPFREWVNGMEWVNGFLPNPFIHDLFLWCTSQEIVKTDLYPLSLMSLRYAVCSTGCAPIIGRCFGVCNGTSCAEERRPQ